MVEKVGLYRDKTSDGIKWRVRWFGRYDPGTGKIKRYSKTFERKADAENFREKMMSEFRQGVERDPSKKRLREYTENWLNNKIGLGGVRPATALLYRVTFTRLYNYFGQDCLLRIISREHATSFLANIAPTGKRTKPLSDWLKLRTFRQCKTVFAEAIRDGIISFNPFDGIEVSGGEANDWFYLRPDEFHKLLNVTPTLREKVLYCLAYTGGLRESEALSLYWTNIDFDEGRVCIKNRPSTEDYPPFYVKDKKGKDGGRRDIPLPKFTLDLLTRLHVEAPACVPFVLMDEHDNQQIRNKWRKCREQNKDWFNRSLANNVLRNFKRRVRQAGIITEGKVLSFHTLRKSCIQNWANFHPMNVVKELAGHSNIETTAEFYSTVDKMHLDAVSKTSDNLMNGSSDDATDHKMTFSGNSGENQKE